MKQYNRVNLPFTGIASFCKFPIHADLETLSADVAVFGIPWDEGTGYRPGARFGPRSLREYSTRFAFHERAIKKGGYWDIEKKKRFLENIRLVDCGDQDILYLKVEETFSAITDSVSKLLSARAFPVLLGGDHSITFPIVRAFRNLGPLHILHLDAHLDYNDSIEGVLLANGSPVKRISELDFVGKIVRWAREESGPGKMPIETLSPGVIRSSRSLNFDTQVSRRFCKRFLSREASTSRSISTS